VARSKLSTLVTARVTRKASSVHAPNPTNLIVILLLPLLLLLRRRRRRRRGHLPLLAFSLLCLRLLLVLIHRLLRMLMFINVISSPPSSSSSMLKYSWKLPGPFGETSFFHEIFNFLECMPGPVSAKYSAQRNILEAFPIPLDRFWSQEGSDKFSANSVVWAARFSQLKDAKRTNNQLPSKSEFALHPYYSSSRKGFPSHLSDQKKALPANGLRDIMSDKMSKYLEFSYSV